VLEGKLAESAAQAQIASALKQSKGGSMKRSAWALSLLGLVGFSAPAFAEESTKVKKTEQYESSPTKDKAKVEKSTKTDTGNGTAKSDTSVTSETKQKNDGTTQMETKTTKKHKPAGSLKSDKTTTKEKTVKDSDGTVIEHEKKTK
jgi:hypothetical protein